MTTCFSCSKEICEDGKAARNDTCARCDADIKCCMNCAFFDTSAHNECHEPQAERVVIKDRSNFCDYFRLKDISEGKPSEAKDPLNDLKALFGE